MSKRNVKHRYEHYCTHVGQKVVIEEFDLLFEYGGKSIGRVRHYKDCLYNGCDGHHRANCPHVDIGKE